MPKFDRHTNFYYAPRPQYSHWEWFKFIMLRVAIPLVLLWDFIQSVANEFLGEWVGRLVLPAQYWHCNIGKTTEKNRFAHQGELSLKKHTVMTHDRAQLDTLTVVHPEQETLDPKYQKYMINFVGNAMCYEEIIPDMIKEAHAHQVNVVGFNFRGVAHSIGTAKSSNDLVIDGIAQVQRILDKGVSPQNIILNGHSLGAAVASLVAHHFHQQSIPVNVFNDRSFSTITNVVVGAIRLKRDTDGAPIGHKDSTSGIIYGWMAKPFIKFALALVMWEMNAGYAFKCIPEAYRDYIVVRTSKKIRSRRIDDAVIPHYASIHKELTAERRKNKAKLDKQIESIKGLLKDNCQSQLIEQLNTLTESREKIKSDRKMQTRRSRENGHTSTWPTLFNRSGKNAESVFDEFFQRVVADHMVNTR